MRKRKTGFMIAVGHCQTRFSLQFHQFACVLVLRLGTSRRPLVGGASCPTTHSPPPKLYFLVYYYHLPSPIARNNTLSVRYACMQSTFKERERERKAGPVMSEFIQRPKERRKYSRQPQDTQVHATSMRCSKICTSGPLAAGKNRSAALLLFPDREPSILRVALLFFGFCFSF